MCTEINRNYHINLEMLINKYFFIGHLRFLICFDNLYVVVICREKTLFFMRFILAFRNIILYNVYSLKLVYIMC